MKLYFAPGAGSLASHIVLFEAGLEFTGECVDMRKRLTADGLDFNSVNPKGYVPALMLKDGTLLTEGPAIVQYVADLVPEKRLAPQAGSLERYQTMEWLNFIATELHKPFVPLFDPTITEERRAAVIARLSDRLAYVERALEGRDYVGGENFGVVDAYLFTVLNWAGVVKFDLSPWPALVAFHARVAARPAVQQALRAEGLIPA